MAKIINMRLYFGRVQIKRRTWERGEDINISSALCKEKAHWNGYTTNSMLRILPNSRIYFFFCLAFRRQCLCFVCSSAGRLTQLLSINPKWNESLRIKLYSYIFSYRRYSHFCRNFFLSLLLLHLFLWQWRSLSLMRFGLSFFVVTSFGCACVTFKP